MLDEGQSRGLDLVMNGGWRRDEETALRYVRWVEGPGKELGMRVANVSERVKSTGRGNYLRSLGLGDRELYDVVGNHFDPDSLAVCLLGPLEAWSRGERRRHTFLHPGRVLASFARVRRWVLAQVGDPPVRHPFPEDLRPYLLLGTGGGADDDVAAEHGRGHE